MVRLNKIYTRTGDGGETGLGDGSRRRKDDARIVAYGTVDELNACIGLALCHADEAFAAELQQIQNDLFDLGADLCVPEDGENRASRLQVTADYIDILEQWIDAHNAHLEPLKSFILPGGSPCSAHLHLARTVARRAERATITLAGLEDINAMAVKYLNRLSDYLFVLARVANQNGTQDVLWQPGKRS